MRGGGRVHRHLLKIMLGIVFAGLCGGGGGRRAGFGYKSRGLFYRGVEEDRKGAVWGKGVGLGGGGFHKKKNK